MPRPMTTSGLVVTLDHRGARLLAYAIEVADRRLRFGQGREAFESRDLTTAVLQPHAGVRKLDEVNLMTGAAPLDAEPAPSVEQLRIQIKNVPERPVKLTLYSVEKGRPDLVEELASGDNYRLPGGLRFAEVLASGHLTATDPELLVVAWTLTERTWQLLQQAR